MLLLVGCFFLFLTKVSAQGPPPEPEEDELEVILMTSIMPSDDEKSLALFDFTPLELILHPEGSSINGSFFINADVTEDFIGVLEITKHENGQSNLVFSMCHNICEQILDENGDFWRPLYSRLDCGGKCPFKSGAIFIKNLSIIVKELDLTHSHIGCYDGLVSFYIGKCDENENVFVGSAYVEFCLERKS